MAKTNINLYRRLTHKYNTAYSHLDNWAFIGEATQRAPEKLRWSFDGNGESGTTKVIVTIRPELLKRFPAKVIERAIEDNYAGSCACEHDCCGCWSTYALAHRVKPRQWSVVIGGYVMSKAILEALKQIEKNPDHSQGICGNLYELTKLGVTYISRPASEWPHYSGDFEFPVPGKSTGYVEAQREGNLWNPNEPQGAYRWSLLAFLIDYYEELLQ